jgi:hypothetical protein
MSRRDTNWMFRLLTVLDELTHESPSIRVARRLMVLDVIDVLSGLFLLCGVPRHIRSDNIPSSSLRSCRIRLEALRRTAVSRVRRPPARRSAGGGDLLFADRAPDRHPELAAALQCCRPKRALGNRPPALEVFVSELTA